MNERRLTRMFSDVRRGFATAESAAARLSKDLRKSHVEELEGIALDHHRVWRKGFPEVIFGEGKTDEQILSAVSALARRGVPALVTRTTARVSEKVRRKHPAARWNAAARALAVLPPHQRKQKGMVAVFAAGTSDASVAEEAAFTSEIFGARVERRFDVGVAGLHRLLRHGRLLASADAVVAVAGMEGALPSVVAGLVEAPVIAVPTSVGYGVGVHGLAALMTMLASCAPGLAVVNIDNGFGAGYLAAHIAVRRYDNPDAPPLPRLRRGKPR